MKLGTGISKRKAGAVAFGVLVATGVLALCPMRAQQTSPLGIKSISVGPDEAVTYPTAAPAPYLAAFPDEHTTFLPPSSGSSTYLMFGAAVVTQGTFGAVVLESTDLKTFKFATDLGYTPQVFASPLAIGPTFCNPAFDTEFDEGYAAPSSVMQDPTLPPGNLMMIYEAEAYCPGGVYQTTNYASVGFTRSSDNGKTWPAPQNGPQGGANRYAVLQPSVPFPTAPHPAAGNQANGAFVDLDSDGHYYLYEAYTYFGTDADGKVRIARAQLGQNHLTFTKWYNGAWSQPGIGGLDSGPVPTSACGHQGMPQISYVDDLGIYLMTLVCTSGSPEVGAWYYSTATSLSLQDWSVPQMIENSQFPVTFPSTCTTSQAGFFDGWYPSFMSPGAANGHLSLTGRVFSMNGCLLGAQRTFMSRTFTITAGPAPVALTTGSAANGATYVSGGLVGGSWAQVKGSNLAKVSNYIWQGSDFAGLGNKLPTSLQGTSVTLNGVPAALYYADKTQVNFQVPNGLSGPVNVQVTNNGVASNIVTTSLAANSPGIFPVIVNGVNYAGGVFLDGRYIGDPSISPAFRKAKAGDIIQLFATALVPSTAGSLPNVTSVSGVTVTIGTVTFPADSAALVGVGEFQINFTVPQQFATLPEASYPITIAANGVSSPVTINSVPPGQVVIPIQH